MSGTGYSRVNLGNIYHAHVRGKPRGKTRVLSPNMILRRIEAALEDLRQAEAKFLDRLKTISCISDPNMRIKSERKTRQKYNEIFANLHANLMTALDDKNYLDRARYEIRND